MKIAVFTHYYLPDTGAPSARISEMVKVWAQKHKVTVFTCFPNHPTGIIPDEYKGKFHKEEKHENYNIIRNYVYATPNKGFLKKIINHLSFMFSVVFLNFFKMKKFDIIIASSPSFFLMFSARFFNIIYRIPYIFEVRDLWPAIFVELDVLKNKFIIKILETLELHLYKKSKAVVTVTDSFKRNIVERGIDDNKVHVIKNGVDLTQFYSKQVEKTIIPEVDLNNKFVVLYIGAHGISQALKKIIDTAKILKNETEIIFLFVGDGAEKEELVKYNKNLKNIKFIGIQPKEKVIEFYNIADICLIPLKDIPLFKTFIPSKMFEIMACACPIVASVDGEAKDILLRSNAALVTEPENSSGIADAILKIKKNNNLAESLSLNGPKFVKKFYDRKQLAKDYLEIIEGLNK